MVKKIKVAIYLENKNIKSIDCRFPEKGNPGIGGTEFNFITLSYYLNKLHNFEIDVLLLANDITLLPGDLKRLKSESILEAETIAKQEMVDIFIFRPKFDSDYKKAYRNLDVLGLKTVIWSHNMLENRALNIINGTKYIVRHICVSREQLDRIRDHRVFSKANYIFNGFDSRIYNNLFVKDKKRPEVTYIGSLVPAKGFHILAKQWKKVVAKVPTAHLNVIGSGTLYSKNVVLGKYGIASKKYENKFIKYLTDKEGHILDSVTFHGNLGVEKLEIIKRTKVGIVNPSAISENCPGVALEFQASGVPVVSRGKFGLLDTVIDGTTGLLSNSKFSIHRKIVKLLLDNDLSLTYGNNGMKFVKEKFNHIHIVNKWVELFKEIIANKPNELLPVKNFWLHNLKWLREANRILKGFIPFGQYIPSLLFYRQVAKDIKNFIIK